MIPNTTSIQDYESKIEKLEHELREMTVALTQAWDQLVPFLQDVPLPSETSYDIHPVLHAVAAAADTELAGVLLFQPRQWFGIPEGAQLTAESVKRLETISEEVTIHLTAEGGAQVFCVIAPIFSEREIVGVLGVGTYNLERVFSAAELRIVYRMAERVGSQVAAAQLAHSREREARLMRDMQIANDIQQSIQPSTAPKTCFIQMANYWQPAREVGGDAWGWVQQPDGRLAWFILDIAGKGLPAALAAMALHTAISIALRMQVSPTAVLSLINEQFYDAYTSTDLMATVAIIALDPQNGSLEVANAGHPPVLVRHAREWCELNATAPPIGVLPMLEAESQRMTLHPGDLVLCYSDGITEVQIGEGLWGQAGLMKTIPSGARDVQALTHHIIAASQKVGQVHDDQTLVTARYMGEFYDEQADDLSSDT